MSIQQALLNRLKQSNPQGYNRLMQLMNSGRNPTDILTEMYQKGEINDEQLTQIVRQGRMFGVNIPQQEVEKIKATTIPQTPKKFGGWF